MKRFLKVGFAGMASLTVIGCAYTPDVSVNYYLPKSSASLTVARTVTCNANNEVVVVDSITPSVVYVADRKSKKSIDLDDLDGVLANTKTGISFYGDGRLKGVNVSTSGQGETVLKGVIGLVSSAVGGGFGFRSEQDVCDYINPGRPKRDGVLTIYYDGTVTGKEVNAAGGTKTVLVTASLKLRDSSNPHMNANNGALKAVLGNADPQISADILETELPVANRSKRADEVKLSMRHPESVLVEVTLPAVNDQADDFKWSTILSLSGEGLGKPYDLPIPKAALFGTQTFGLAVSESGAVTEISYGKDTGAAQVLAVGKSAYDAFGPKTDAERAEEYKGEADRIAQQQRLARCRADPANCI